MHADFRNHFIRISLLYQAEKNKIDKESVFGTLQARGFYEITEDEIEEHIKYLASENFLEKIDGDKYKTSEVGSKELFEVKDVIKNL
jgi:hypothetical protein